MDSFFHKDKPTTTGTTADHPGHHPKPSKSELLSSAKLLAESAKSGNNVDKTKIAGAAADLLDAAATYGKFDEKQGLGKYMDKAEDYLHQYHTSHSTTTAAGHTATETTTTTTTTLHSSTNSVRDKHSSGGGYGDVIHMAEGFFKKH